MRSATNPGKECKHMTHSSLFVKPEGYCISDEKKVSCAETLDALLLLRRDLRNYFTEDQKQVVYNQKPVRISGIGAKIRDKLIKASTCKGIRYSYIEFFENLFSEVLLGYAKSYFDYVNESLDEHIGLLKENFKKKFGCSEDDVDRIFQAGNVPEDFCSSFSTKSLSRKIASVLDRIIFCLGKDSGSAQHAGVSYFTRGGAMVLSEFCDKESLNFSELNSLINNLFLGLCQYLAWKVFLGELFGYPGSDKLDHGGANSCKGAGILLKKRSPIVKNKLNPCIKYFKDRIFETREDAFKTREDAVDPILQKNSLTILQDFTAASPKKGADYDLVRESLVDLELEKFLPYSEYDFVRDSFLVDLELGDPMKSSLYSIEGENSSDIVQQSSDLLSEEVEGGLIYSSKNDSIGATALFKNSPIVKKKRKALQCGEEIEPKFKKVVVEEIEGAKRAAEQEMQLIKDYEGVDRCTSSSRSPSYYINEVLSGGLGFSTNTLIRK